MIWMSSSLYSPGITRNRRTSEEARAIMELRASILLTSHLENCSARTQILRRIRLNQAEIGHNRTIYSPCRSNRKRSIKSMTRTKMMRVFSTRDKAILMTTSWTSYRRAYSSRMPFKLRNQSKTKESKAINHPRRIPTTSFLRRSGMRINTRKDSNSRSAAP